MPGSLPLNEPGLVARWRSLSFGDRARLLALTLLLPLVDLSLRGLGLRRTQQLLGLDRDEVDPPVAPEAAVAAQRLAQLAAIAGRHGLYLNTCLRQALAVQWWLRRRGLPSQLRIGARRNGDTLDAHAWVELGGLPLAQGPDLPPVFR